MSSNDIFLIEELAANAWPADMVQHLDGWRLRYSHGVTRRINSVWPNLDFGHHPLAEKLALVEAFYGRRQAVPRFQICPAAQPEGLDAALAARGYVLDAPTYVQTAVLLQVQAQTLSSRRPTVTLQTELPPSWLDFYQEVEALNEHAIGVRRRILQRVALPMAFAQAFQDGRLVGIGLGVAERGWVGIFTMLTRPDARRQGVATAVLHELAAWGNQQQGAGHMYLQVMQNNSAALALYGRCGFTTHYSYHYRELPAP
ncbi:MAG: GNAT family N-acetyltransferase [Anaerolineales bacterium]|nr:GNAT family N-acetyltransferase [Anaerolineales bacterium]